MNFRRGIDLAEDVVSGGGEGTVTVVIESRPIIGVKAVDAGCDRANQCLTQVELHFGDVLGWSDCCNKRINGSSVGGVSVGSEGYRRNGTGINVHFNTSPSGAAFPVRNLVMEPVGGVTLGSLWRRVMDGLAVVDDGRSPVSRRCYRDNRQRVAIGIGVVGQNIKHVVDAVDQNDGMIVIGDGRTILARGIHRDVDAGGHADAAFAVPRQSHQRVGARLGDVPVDGIGGVGVVAYQP